jgi:hypothetical protein
VIVGRSFVAVGNKVCSTVGTTVGAAVGTTFFPPQPAIINANIEMHKRKNPSILDFFAMSSSSN